MRSLANSICFRPSNLDGSNIIHTLTTPVLLKLKMIVGKESGKALLHKSVTTKKSLFPFIIYRPPS